MATIVEPSSFPELPELVLLKIFHYLSVQELASFRTVCKKWNNLIHTDSLWKKFIPKLAGFVPPKRSSALRTISALWKSSVKIGNERWYPNPFPELVRYEKVLRKAESHQFLSRHSTTTLYVRLNPCYELTTQGKDTDDPNMTTVCNDIWENFKDKRDIEMSHEIQSNIDVMKRAQFHTRKKAMKNLLDELEPPYWFLESLGLERRELDEDGNVMSKTPNEDDQEVQEDNLGDIFVSDNETIFGSYRNYTAWTAKVNRRLPLHLYDQIHSLFSGDNFIEFLLSDGCWNENFEYAFSVLVSDNAAFYIEHFFEL